MNRKLDYGYLESFRGEVVSSSRCLGRRFEQSANAAVSGNAVPVDTMLARLALLVAVDNPARDTLWPTLCRACSKAAATNEMQLDS